MSTHQEKCERECAANLQACQEQARAEYDRLRQQCMSIPDPNDQAACMARAAEAYKAMLEGCQSEYQVCLQICRGGYY